MDLYSQIIMVYPELIPTETHDEFMNGSIRLQDDGDGIQYIAKWEYSKPLPDGMKVGKN
jgi:hypothetical protein